MQVAPSQPIVVALFDYLILVIVFHMNGTSNVFCSLSPIRILMTMGSMVLKIVITLFFFLKINFINQERNNTIA